MKAAYFAKQTQQQAETEGCTPEQLMMSDEYREEDTERFYTGLTLLEQWRYTVGMRTTIYPSIGENQLVIDAGWLATSPAYAVATFVRRITAHKGGRTVKRSSDVSAEVNEMLTWLRQEHDISLGDLIEEAARQKYTELHGA